MRPKPLAAHATPADGAATTDGTPVIGVKVTDAETEFTKNNVALFLEGAKVERAKWVYNPDNHRVSYVPASDLSSGVHKVKIVARDPQGLVTRETWHLSVATG
ncbi:MAG: hypothetical protein M3358_13410 [Actinomycetota bacterium]|nr:hypothetical protein [Actinomycetota bacterium]